MEPKKRPAGRPKAKAKTVDPVVHEEDADMEPEEVGANVLLMI